MIAFASKFSTLSVLNYLSLKHWRPSPSGSYFLSYITLICVRFKGTYKSLLFNFRKNTNNGSELLNSNFPDFIRIVVDND